MSRIKLKGFTIVELLVVIVVIAILASVSVVTYNGIQGRARDAQRLSDAKSIEKILRIYLARNGSFFGPTSVNGSWEESYEDGPGLFMETLVTSKSVNSVPVDPVNNASQHYRFYKYPAGNAGCDASRGDFIVFQIKDMETSGRPHPASPEFNCPSRSWGAEADYTVGIYENG